MIILMTLLFVGAMPYSLGALANEVLSILEARRKYVLQLKGLNDIEEGAVLLQMGII